MKKLARAIAQMAYEVPSFSGTTYAVAKLMRGVSHQQIANLLDGRTPPHKVTVHTMQEICRVFPGIKPGDFGGGEHGEDGEGCEPWDGGGEAA